MNLIGPLSKDLLGAQSRWALDTEASTKRLPPSPKRARKKERHGISLTDIPLENEASLKEKYISQHFAGCGNQQQSLDIELLCISRLQRQSMGGGKTLVTLKTEDF